MLIFLLERAWESILNELRDRDMAENRQQQVILFMYIILYSGTSTLFCKFHTLCIISYIYLDRVCVTKHFCCQVYWQGVSLEANLTPGQLAPC